MAEATGNGGNSKRAFIAIDKETRLLVPLGALAALVYLIWTVSSAWNSQALEVTRLRADLTALTAGTAEDWKVIDIRLRKLEGSLLGQTQEGENDGSVRTLQGRTLLTEGAGGDRRRSLGGGAQSVDAGGAGGLGGDARQIRGGR